MFWFSVWSWSVLALLDTSALAEELAVCDAVLGPELTLPPAIETGTFALTAFWSLLAIPIASCSVSAFWTPSWKPPAPPQPAKQPSLPSLPSRPCLPSRPSLPSHPQRLLVPTFWRSDWSWSVLAVIETGTLALTAFWSLLAIPIAACSVSAFWTPSWKPPPPPQPSLQDPPPMFWLRCWSWSVFALLETSAFAVDVAVWLAVVGPEETCPPAIAAGALPFTAF